MKTTKMILALYLFIALQSFAQTFSKESDNIINVANTYSTPTITIIDSDNYLDLFSSKGNYLAYYEQNEVDGIPFTRKSIYFSSTQIDGGWAYPTFVDLDSDGLLDLQLN